MPAFATTWLELAGTTFCVGPSKFIRPETKLCPLVVLILHPRPKELLLTAIWSDAVALDTGGAIAAKPALAVCLHSVVLGDQLFVVLDHCTWHRKGRSAFMTNGPSFNIPSPSPSSRSSSASDVTERDAAPCGAQFALNAALSHVYGKNKRKSTILGDAQKYISPKSLGKVRRCLCPHDVQGQTFHMAAGLAAKDGRLECHVAQIGVLFVAKWLVSSCFPLETTLKRSNRPKEGQKEKVTQNWATKWAPKL